MPKESKNNLMEKSNPREKDLIDSAITNITPKKVREKMNKALAIGLATVALEGAGEVGIKEALANALVKTKGEVASTESSQQKIRKEKIKNQIDERTMRFGTNYKTGSLAHTGSKVRIGGEIQTDKEISVKNIVSTGSIVSTGAGGNQGYNNLNYILNRNIYEGGYRDPMGQYHDITGRVYSPELSHSENVILQNHPEFAYNPFGLSPKELMRTFQARNEDIEYVFRGIKSNWTWDKLGDLKAGKILESGEGLNSDPAIIKLSQWLNLLKNFTGLEPKSGFLGMGAENSEYYIARALQALEAGRGKVSLEEFQAILKK